MAVTNRASILLKSGWLSANFSKGFGHHASRLLSPEVGHQSSSSGSIPDVPGLSSNVVQVPSGKVGPGAAKDSDYKHPEYFGFNVNSYYEAETEMAKFRLPQPSNTN